MNILLIAPQPFYQERGTPIAIKLLAQTLCEAGHRVDLLTYHEGQDVAMEGLHIERIPTIPFVKKIPIGFSWKKLVCDMLLSAKIIPMLRRNRYDVIHAIEEAIFPALVINRFARKRVVYDMDSSLADQLIEKWPTLRHIGALLNGFEGWAVRNADTVFAVCSDLGAKAREHAPGQTIHILEDVPLPADAEPAEPEDLRAELDIRGKLLLYVGNLEHYQGIDLLLESIAACDRPIDLVLIGGSSADLAKYRDQATQLGVGERVHLVGPRPVARLNDYLSQADILVSPRLKGSNTPMKIYSYMAAGKPILATDIRSHTQVLTENCAVLVAPRAEAMAEGINRLVDDHELCAVLGSAARTLAAQRYSLDAFRRKVAAGYSGLTASG